MSLAKAVITGQVYRAPEKRFTSNNVPITAFTMNISENEESLIRVITKGKLAETTADAISRGDKVIVEGRLQNNTIKNEDGSEKRIVEIDAFAIETMGSGGAGGGVSSSVSEKSDSIVQFGEQPDFGDELIGEDEIPF